MLVEDSELEAIFKPDYEAASVSFVLADFKQAYTDCMSVLRWAVAAFIYHDMSTEQLNNNQTSFKQIQKSLKAFHLVSFYISGVVVDNLISLVEFLKLETIFSIICL